MADKFDIWKTAGFPRPAKFEGRDLAFLAIEDEINRLREKVGQ